jgi:hypothetical protein
MHRRWRTGEARSQEGSASTTGVGAAVRRLSAVGSLSGATTPARAPTSIWSVGHRRSNLLADIGHMTAAWDADPTRDRLSALPKFFLPTAVQDDRIFPALAVELGAPDHAHPRVLTSVPNDRVLRRRDPSCRARRPRPCDRARGRHRRGPRCGRGVICFFTSPPKDGSPSVAHLRDKQASLSRQGAEKPR